MLRVCPDCHGNKVVHVANPFASYDKIQRCHTCDGRGTLTSSRNRRGLPSSRKVIRAKAPKELRERREAS
jgi:DnaJ-class molecular chaperone